MVKATSPPKSTQLNPPITELITITINTTTYPTKLNKFHNGGIFYCRQCPYRIYFLKEVYLFFLEVLIVTIANCCVKEGNLVLSTELIAYIYQYKEFQSRRQSEWRNIWLYVCENGATPIG